MKRTIYLNGRITSEIAFQFAKEFYQLLDESCTLPIHLIISSRGGSVEAGHMICDILQESPVLIYAYGIEYVGSIASIIFLNANYRYMLPRTKLMVHEPRADMTGMTTSGELRSLEYTIKTMGDSFANVMCEASKGYITHNEALVILAAGMTYTAQEALHCNLIDGIGILNHYNE